MADTFSINTGDASSVPVQPQGGSNQGQGIRLAPAGDMGMSGLGQSRPTVDPNAAALLDIASSILQPDIKAARQQQFMQGVQEAATGKALTEIINDRPWFTKLFGPGAAADGARAYTVQAQLAGFAADMENQMPKLAEQGPEAVRAAVNERLQSVLTGDPVADAVISGAAVEQFGPLFKRHAKEHYVFLQNKASDAQLNAWSKAASVLQAQLADPKTLPEDREAAKSRLLGQIAPFGDQTEASYNKNIATLISTAATNGDFHLIRMFKETMLPGDDGKEMSLWERVPIDDRAKIDAALPGLAQRALNKYVPQYAVEMALMMNDTAQNPALFPARAKAFNDKVAAETGIVEAQMIPPQNIDNVVGHILKDQAAARLRVDPKAEQAQREMIAQAMLLQPGAMVKAVALKQTNDAAAEAAAGQYWVANPDPIKRAEMLNMRGGGSYDFARADMYSMGIGSNQTENTKGVEQVAATYAHMTDATRGAYFSTDEAIFYDRYNSQVRAGVPPDQAFRNAKLTQDYAKFVLPEKEKSEVQQAIRAEAERRNENFLNWNKVTDPALRAIEAAISKDYTRNRGINSVEASVARSYTRALANGLEIIGKHAAIGNAGQTPLVNLLSTGKGNIGPAEVAKRFDAAVEQKIKAAGGSLDDYYIIRTADVDGDARYIVESSDADGIPHYAVITGGELRQAPATPKPAAPATVPGLEAYYNLGIQP